MIHFQALPLLSPSYLVIGPKFPLNTTQRGKMIPKNHPKTLVQRDGAWATLNWWGDYTSSQYVQSMRNAGREGKEPRGMKNKWNRGNDVRAVPSGRNTVEVMGEMMQREYN